VCTVKCYTVVVICYTDMNMTEKRFKCDLALGNWGLSLTMTGGNGLF